METHLKEIYGFNSFRDNQKEIIDLFHFQGLTHEEIALELDINKNTSMGSFFIIESF